MGLVRMAARTAVVAGTATAVSGRVAQRQADSHAEQQANAAPPAAAESDDSAEKLKQLADLHAQGVLTDEEFAAAKAKALGI
jgi:membrane protease subunit (stomatin/prohibitin family)